MRRPPLTRSPANVFAELDVKEPDVALTKADLAVRIHRLAEHRRLTSDEAAELLQVPKPELQSLFQGRLATCSLDQLLRMLTWLGDDIEILIRPRLQRRNRGALRVLQAAALEKPYDLAPVSRGRAKGPLATHQQESANQDQVADISAPSRTRDDRQLVAKHAVEKMTSLDITTIYRKMSAGEFPQPLRVGWRRVAWRTSDVIRRQQGLQVGTESAEWMKARWSGGYRGAGKKKPRNHM